MRSTWLAHRFGWRHEISMNRRSFLAFLPSGAALAGQSPQPTRASEDNELDELTIDNLSRAMQTGRYTARRITELYLGRIEATNRRGPMLRAVIEINPEAFAIAAGLDIERKNGRMRGPMHGIPVLLKANIGTADRTHTTAGSMALADWIPPQDAFIVQRLRAAGAVLLGKANLSEWAGGRGLGRIGGWSALGGQTRNPYVLDRSPQGSSAGLGVGVSANLGACAVGTDTGGSVTYPASANGVVGLRPTLGLLSRVGIIPLSLSRDTAGPMARTVRDTAVLLGAMVGADPQDAATAPSASRLHSDYTQFLTPHGLRGARLAVAREYFGFHPGADALIESCMKVLKEEGAELFEQADLLSSAPYQQDSGLVSRYDLKADLNEYLAKLPSHLPVRSLTELIAFNEQHHDQELRYYGQSNLIAAEKAGERSEKKYQDARTRCRRLSGAEGIDAVLAKHRADAIIAPSLTPAFVTDWVMGDGRSNACTIPACTAGYPHITVPPDSWTDCRWGSSFFGTAWSEPVLFRLAYAFEQATKARRKPQFLPTLNFPG